MSCTASFDVFLATSARPCAEDFAKYATLEQHAEGVPVTLALDAAASKAKGVVAGLSLQVTWQGGLETSTRPMLNLLLFLLLLLLLFLLLVLLLLLLLLLLLPLLLLLLLFLLLLLLLMYV